MRTQSNYLDVIGKSRFEVRDPKATNKTIPDMTYSPAELLTRFAKGLPMDKLRMFSYHGDLDVPDVRKMDMTEIDDALDKARFDYESKNKELQNKIATRKARREQEQKNYREFQKTMSERSKSEDVKGTTEK